MNCSTEIFMPEHHHMLICPGLKQLIPIRTAWTRANNKLSKAATSWLMNFYLRISICWGYQCIILECPVCWRPTWIILSVLTEHFYLTRKINPNLTNRLFRPPEKCTYWLQPGMMDSVKENGNTNWTTWNPTSIRHLGLSGSKIPPLYNVETMNTEEQNWNSPFR